MFRLPDHNIRFYIPLSASRTFESQAAMEAWAEAFAPQINITPREGESSLTLRRVMERLAGKRDIAVVFNSPCLVLRRTLRVGDVRNDPVVESAFEEVASERGWDAFSPVLLNLRSLLSYVVTAEGDWTLCGEPLDEVSNLFPAWESLDIKAKLRALLCLDPGDVRDALNAARSDVLTEEELGKCWPQSPSSTALPTPTTAQHVRKAAP